MTATDSEAKSVKIKIATFHFHVGEDAVEVFITLNLTDEQREIHDAVLRAFQEPYQHKTNGVYERLMLYKTNQKDGEPLDVFLMEIKKLTKSCEFKNTENQMLRDRIVSGIFDKKLQTKLLEVEKLGYNTAVEKCRAAELTQEQSAQMNETLAEKSIMGMQAEIIELNKAKFEKGNKGKHNRNKNTNKFSNDSQKYVETQERDDGKRDRCSFCNGHHEPRAYGQNCKRCSKNHFAAACRTKNIREIVIIDNNSNDDDFYIDSIRSTRSQMVCACTQSSWFERVRIGNMLVDFRIDTGADVNVVSRSLIESGCPPVGIVPTSIEMDGYFGETNKPVGMCFLPYLHKNKSYADEFSVIEPIRRRLLVLILRLFI